MAAHPFSHNGQNFTITVKPPFDVNAFSQPEDRASIPYLLEVTDRTNRVIHSGSITRNIAMHLQAIHGIAAEEMLVSMAQNHIREQY